ncbi:hypothetical protein [Vibrio owensii]|uniref:hypothetical protein n=1 Tax=Vibrio harveyi group TaxID=717610 RepID=UPI003CC57EA4
MHIYKRESIKCIPHTPERLRLALQQYGYIIPANVKLTALQFSKMIRHNLPNDLKAQKASKQLEDLWSLYQNGLTPSEVSEARSEGWALCYQNTTNLDFESLESQRDSSNAYKLIKKGLLAQSPLHLKAYNLARVFNPEIALKIAKTRA